jgi:hypothetical protein
MLRRLHPLAVCAAATVLACWKVIFHSEFTLLAGSDMARAYYPYFDVAAYWLKKGVFLLWDPYVYAGKPTMGEPQPGLFYPLNWVFMLLPARDGGVNPDGLQALLILDYFLAACFTWQLARSLGLTARGAAVAAVGFAYGGYMVQVYGYVNKLSGYVWLPLVLLFFRKGLDAPEGAARRRALLWCALALAVSFLPGHHVPPIHAGLLLLLFALYRAMSAGRRERLHMAGALLLVAAVALLITAVQWLPSAEWARRVYRWVGDGPPLVWGEKVPYGSLAESGALRPQDALSLVLPYVSTASNLYVGAPFLFLAATGLLFGRGRDARFFGASAVLYFFASWGGLSALHGWLNTFLPGVWFAREVFHYLIPFQLCLALLAGWGLDALAEAFGEGPAAPVREYVRRAGWGLAVLAPGALALVAVLHLARDRPLDHPHLTGLGALAAYAAVLGLLLFLLYTRRLEARLCAIALGALVLLDLGSEFSRRVPPKLLPHGEENTYVREFWKKQPAGVFLTTERRRRIFRVDDPGNCFEAEYGDVWRLESTMGHGATARVDYFALRGTGWGPASNASALLNVRFFPSRTPIAGMRRVFHGDPPVYENPRAVPRAFLANRYRVFSSDADLLRWVASPLFVPLETVLLRPAERARLEPALSPGLDEEDGLRLRVVSVRTAADIAGEGLSDPAERQRLLRYQPPWGWSIGDEVRVALRPEQRIEQCWLEVEYEPAAEPARVEVRLQGPGGTRTARVDLAARPEVPASAESGPAEPARAAVDLGPLEAGETVLALERTAACGANLRAVRIRRRPERDPVPPGEASIDLYEPNRLAVKLRAARPSLLVLSEVYYPGWVAELDGGPVPLASGDHVLRVAPVPAGEHTVVVRFRSKTFLVGLAVTLLSLGGVALVLVAGRAKER